MSDEKVLTTPEAKAAIKSLQSLITGGFTGEISKLDAQGKQLSDPNNWDGPLARRFRSDTWPGVHSSLQKAKTELEELRGQLDKIAQNITQAGS